MPALSVENNTVGIFKLNKMMVEYFAVIFAYAHLTATHTLRFNGVAIHHPVYYVYVVYVLFINVIAAKPYKIIPVTHLVLHLRPAGLSWVHPNTVVVPPCLCANYVAYHAVLHAFHYFPVTCLVPALQANHHVQFFLFSYFSSGQYTLYTR